MVKVGKDFAGEVMPVAPFEFGGIGYYPSSRLLFKYETNERATLPPIPARILKLLLDRYPDSLPVSELHKEIWRGVEEDSFGKRLKSHKDTLRRELEGVGLKGVLKRHNDSLSLNVYVRKSFINEGAADTPPNVVGTPPRGVTEVFRDRVEEISQVTHSLLNAPNLRGVNIYGRFGVGKTALAYQAVDGLLRDGRAEGLVFLSPHAVSVEQIFRHCAQMLGGQAEHTLRDVWADARPPVSHKIQVLVEQVGARRCVIFLDGIEGLMSEGRLLDPDLDQFVDIFLSRRHKARLLITSTEPLYTSTLDNQHYLSHFQLDKGLPREDAVGFFLSLDYDGAAHLREIPRRLLDEIVDRTLGIPRALLYVANILASRPALSLRDLLGKEELFDAEIIEKLGREAQASLDENERKVMQALSVYNHPATAAAVAHLLEPYVAPAVVEEKLERLARGRYITVEREPSRMKFGAQQWDTKLNYNEIPTEEGDALYNRRALHTRAAEYFARVAREKSEWKTLSDIEEPLAEFEQRVKAGDYARAFDLAQDLDAEYLSARGYHQQVISMREALREPPPARKGASSNLPPEREAVNLRLLSGAYLNAGKPDHAQLFAQYALKLAQTHKIKLEEARALRALASALHRLGLYRQAESNYQNALVIARAAHSQALEGVLLRQLGQLYRDSAQHKRALKYLEDAHSMAVDTENDAARCLALKDIGRSFMETGRFEESLKKHREALDIARRLGQRKTEGVCLMHVGATLRELGDYAGATDYLEGSLSIAREMSDAVTEMRALGGLGKVRLALSDEAEAKEMVQRALEMAANLNMIGSEQHWGTWLAQIYLHQNSLPSAQEAIKKPLKLDTPWNNYRTSLVGGIIFARVSRSAGRGPSVDARLAFERARAVADELLTTTANYYAAQYTRCVTFYGLALLSSGAERAKCLDLAQGSLNEALSLCSEAGVLRDYSRLLEELSPLDGDDVLTPALRALGARPG